MQEKNRRVAYIPLRIKELQRTYYTRFDFAVNLRQRDNPLSPTEDYTRFDFAVNLRRLKDAMVSADNYTRFDFAVNLRPLR